MPSTNFTKQDNRQLRELCKVARAHKGDTAQGQKQNVGSNKVERRDWPQERRERTGRQSERRQRVHCKAKKLSRHQKSTETKQAAAPTCLAVPVSIGTSSR